MATDMRAASNKVRHDNHTAPGSLTERTFTVPANFLIIYNAGATSAAISFDGTNEFPIPAGSTLSMDLCKQVSYYTSGSVALKVMYGAEI